MMRTFPIGSIVSLPELERLKFVVAGTYSGAIGQVVHLQPVDPRWPDCALKLLADNGRWQAAEREARRWVALGEHTGLAHAYWAGYWEGQPAILARWYPRTMADVRPTEWTAAGLEHTLQDLVDGLEYAYSRLGLIHRDIKPPNILLDQQNAPRLADFGLAYIAPPLPRPLQAMSDLRSAMSASITQADIAGTPLYMAPELFAGAPASVVTDIFSLGVTLYELLTGQHPYLGPDTGMKGQLLLRERPLQVALQQIAPHKPELEALIRRCLALNPLERPSSYGALLAVIGLRKPAARQQTIAAEKGRHPDAPAIVAFATTLRNQGQVERAREVLADARGPSPDDPLLLNASASVEMRAGNTQEAFRFWHRAGELLVASDGFYDGGVYADPLLNLGRQYISRDDFDRAAYWLQLARRYMLRHKPGLLTSFAEVGWLSLYEGDADEAFRTLLAHATSAQCDEFALRCLTLAALLTRGLPATAGRLDQIIESLGVAKSGVAVTACLVASHLPLERGRTLIAQACEAHPDLFRSMLREQGLDTQDLGPPLHPKLAHAIASTLDTVVTGGRNHEILRSL